MRSLIRETQVETGDLVYPLFVVEGRGIVEEIPSMPGVARYSVDRLGNIMEQVASLEIPAVILFGIPASKDETGSSAYAENGVVQQAVRFIKHNFPQLLVITDVCLCEYTSHGHCGVVINGQVDNDSTLPLLAKTALSHVQAGADMVAPADMMDGRVKAIRDVLDEHGFTHTPILSYAVKYASAFYGPFREAAESAPQFGDRRSYQMDIANIKEALLEAEEDIAEGADIIMVKPALPCLDVVKAVRERFNHPLAAYNVSGEYVMVKAAALRGWIDEEKVVKEILTSIRRAGADFIITYHALDFARWAKSKT